MIYQTIKRLVFHRDDLILFAKTAGYIFPDDAKYGFAQAEDEFYIEWTETDGDIKFNWAPIDKSIKDNQKLQAIKKYREMTGTGLKTAKEKIETRMKELER